MITVKPELLLWAQRNSYRSREDMCQQFSSWNHWVTQNNIIELPVSDVMRIADYTHISLWDIISDQLPILTLPIPDLRGGVHSEPTRKLVDIIYYNQQRQHWYKEHPLKHGIQSSVCLLDDVELKRIEENRDRNKLISMIENQGVTVVIDSACEISVSEMNSFALYDIIAPLIFVNGQNNIEQQIVSLYCEHMNICCGISGVNNSASCATHTGDSYWISDHFMLAVIVSTLEGETSYTEALRLLNMENLIEFNELAESFRLK